VSQIQNAQKALARREAVDDARIATRKLLKEEADQAGAQ